MLQLAQPTDPSTYQSAAAKVGKVDVNTTVLSDGTRSFIRLAKGPERLTETRAADDHRYLMQWPSFAGRGATLSMWYRCVPELNTLCPLSMTTPPSRSCLAV